MRVLRVGWIIWFTAMGIWTTYLAFHRNDMRPMFAAMIYFTMAFVAWYVEHKVRRRALQERDEM